MNQTRLDNLYQEIEAHWSSAMTTIQHIRDADMIGELDSYALTEAAYRYEELGFEIERLCERRVDLLETFDCLPSGDE